VSTGTGKGSNHVGKLEREVFSAALDAWRREHDMWLKRVERAQDRSAALLGLIVTLIAALAVALGSEVGPDSRAAIVGVLALSVVTLSRAAVYAMFGRSLIGGNVGRRVTTRIKRKINDLLDQAEDPGTPQLHERRMKERVKEDAVSGALDTHTRYADEVFLLDRPVESWSEVDWQRWLVEAEKRRALSRRNQARDREHALLVARGYFALGAALGGMGAYATLGIDAPI
jgi:hypothetical protein